MLCAPSAKFLVSQTASVAHVPPSILMLIAPMLWLSDQLEDILTVPPSTAPAKGAVIVPYGGVLSTHVTLLVA